MTEEAQLLRDIQLELLELALRGDLEAFEVFADNTLSQIESLIGDSEALFERSESSDDG